MTMTMTEMEQRLESLEYNFAALGTVVSLLILDADKLSPTEWKRRAQAALAAIKQGAE